MFQKKLADMATQIAFDLEACLRVGRNIDESRPRDWFIEFGRRALKLMLGDDATFVGRMIIDQGRAFPMLRETFESIAVYPLHEAATEKIQALYDHGFLIAGDPDADALLYTDMLLGGWVARKLFGTAEILKEDFYEVQAKRAADFFLAARLLPTVESGKIGDIQICAKEDRRSRTASMLMTGGT